MRPGRPIRLTLALALVLVLTAAGAACNSPPKRAAPLSNAAPTPIPTTSHAPPAAVVTTTASHSAQPLVIDVTARQFDWTFKYPGGKTSHELHLPPDRRVEFRLTSLDVIHSMYIPALRVKADALPARTSTAAALTPAAAAEFPLQCVELCGVGHSTCGAKVFIQAAGDFDAWLARP